MLDLRSQKRSFCLKNTAAQTRSLTFDPIKRPRAFEEVCERIRQQLAAGALRPGDKLPAERELALQLGVSRTALREALRSLEIAGIVILRKGVKGGAFIRQGDPTSMTRLMQDLVHLGAISITDLTEARLVILKDIVLLACERATEADLKLLHVNIENTAEMIRLGRNEERTRYVTEFYRLLALSTRNEILTMLVDALSEILMRFLRNIPDRRSQGLPGLIESRMRLLGHIKARDAVKAIKELESRLMELHRVMVRAYSRTAKNAPHSAARSTNRSV
jgi:GntR family transcriptional regulator, transcriptional repressor for pyruvate dehydrogenase complex